LRYMPTSCVHFYLEGSGPHRVLNSFPTRRSSDLSSTFDSVLVRSIWASIWSGSTMSPSRTIRSSRMPPSRDWMTCSREMGITRRSEEHTSELQSREKLVCRLLLEKKKKRARNDER